MKDNNKINKTRTIENRCNISYTLIIGLIKQKKKNRFFLLFIWAVTNFYGKNKVSSTNGILKFSKFTVAYG